MRVSDFHLLSKKSYGHATLDMLNWIQGAPGGNCNHMRIRNFSVPCASPKSGYMWREGKDWLWQTLEGSDQKKIETFQIFFLTFQINTFSSWELFFLEWRQVKCSESRFLQESEYCRFVQKYICFTFLFNKSNLEFQRFTHSIMFLFFLLHIYLFVFTQSV